MGLFGGGNSTSNTTNLTQTENSDSRVVADAGSTVINAGGGQVTLTDEGLVAAALDSARNSYDLSNKSLADLIGLTRDAGEENRQALSLISQQSNDAFSKLTSANSVAFEKISAAQAQGFNALTDATTSTLDKFIGLAADIAATGANSVNQQAKSLSDSFATVAGNNPDALMKLAGVLVVGFLVWKFAR